MGSSPVMHLVEAPKVHLPTRLEHVIYGHNSANHLLVKAKLRARQSVSLPYLRLSVVHSLHSSRVQRQYLAGSQDSLQNIYLQTAAFIISSEGP